MKHYRYLLALLVSFCLLLCGCGATEAAEVTEAPAAEEELTLDIQELAGDYHLKKLVIDGKDETDSIAAMDAIGLSAALTLNEEGHGLLTVFNDAVEVAFDMENMVLRDLNDLCNVLPVSVFDSEITVHYLDRELSFER